MPRNPFARISHWLHTMYPQGAVEPLPVVNEDGSTRVPGLYVAGDLSGIPLLRFSQDAGSRVVQEIVDDPSFKTREGLSGVDGTVDIAILGAGVAGISAALECQSRGLSYVVLEATEAFSTIVNFPKCKPIYLYPVEMQPAGGLRITANVKEELIEELCRQVERHELNIRCGFRATHVERHDGLLHIHTAEGQTVPAHRVIVAIGRSGNFRRLDVPGEDLDKVGNRLFDPEDFSHQRVVIVGGGDSAVEAAIAIAEAGGAVTLSYRGEELTRPKPGNLERVQALLSHSPRPGRIHLLLQSVVVEIGEKEVRLKTLPSGNMVSIENNAVLTLLGREAPLEFFRRSGVPIHGEWRPLRAVGFAAFLIFCLWLYNWKGGGVFTELFRHRGWFPFNVDPLLAGVGTNPATLAGTIRISMGSPSYYYTLAYCLVVTIFGIRRIRRRQTPYVKWQTITLILIQVIPLFLLPEILLPWLGHNGVFDGGLAGAVADNLFPVDGSGHGRQYWRASGLILAWPLFLYNFFTDQPMAWWLVIGCLQTFVLIPGMIFLWGKGAYCGWICSCGALAETLGDTHRQKMPHGPFWSRLNMAGQVILWMAVALMLLRITGWIWPNSWAETAFNTLFAGSYSRTVNDSASHYLDTKVYRNALNYKWIVDVTLAGVIGVGFYFWYSGRVWCRFFCPLAALMHIYSKFSRFRIIPEKKKCISCNVCTSVCHQGIDVMSFANRGVAMEDPECVRCSACVQSCPTGVLQFGQVDKNGNVIGTDRLAASPVLMAEARREGCSK